MSQRGCAGKGEGMSLTAFAAGHMVGGAVWQVLTREGEQLVYAVQWNHRKDRHLQRADLGGRFSRPALLITDACSALKPPLDTTRRDQELVSRLLTTLKADGEVFFPGLLAGMLGFLCSTCISTSFLWLGSPFQWGIGGGCLYAIGLFN